MDSFIRYKIFEPFGQVLAFTTTKQSLDDPLARFTGDHESVYHNSRRQLAQQLGIEVGQLVFPRQSHSANVCCVDEVPQNEIGETDALVSRQPGLCVCVQTADCVPVLLFDPEQNVVAAVHAGWRGTVAKIVQKTVRKMEHEFGSNPAGIWAAIGPSIGPDVYEVGDEVVEAVRASLPQAEATLQLKGSGRYHFDLWEANRQLLLATGVLAANIEVMAECSFLEAGKYYSARREGVATGRMVSGILLKA